MSCWASGGGDDASSVLEMRADSLFLMPYSPNHRKT